MYVREKRAKSPILLLSSRAFFLERDLDGRQVGRLIARFDQTRSRDMLFDGADAIADSLTLAVFEPLDPPKVYTQGMVPSVSSQSSAVVVSRLVLRCPRLS